MKIAIACENQKVSAHFGHCEGFKVYDVKEQQIVDESYVENPGHRPGYLPVFLKELGTELIIAGGMGQMAQQLFNENDIEVIVGAKGSVEDALHDYLGGNLVSSGSVCTEHAHDGHCHE